MNGIKKWCIFNAFPSRNRLYHLNCFFLLLLSHLFNLQVCVNSSKQICSLYFWLTMIFSCISELLHFFKFLLRKKENWEPSSLTPQTILQPFTLLVTSNKTLQNIEPLTKLLRAFLNTEFCLQSKSRQMQDMKTLLFLKQSRNVF